MEIPTRENAAVLFLDLQDEIVKNSRTLPIERLSRTAGALATPFGRHLEIPNLECARRRQPSPILDW
jgi:hypothetical protein